jgi:hypothetical protein
MKYDNQTIEYRRIFSLVPTRIRCIIYQVLPSGYACFPPKKGSRPKIKNLGRLIGFIAAEQIAANIATETKTTPANCTN